MVSDAGTHRCYMEVPGHSVDHPSFDRSDVSYRNTFTYRCPMLQELEMNSRIERTCVAAFKVRIRDTRTLVQFGGGEHSRVFQKTWKNFFSPMFCLVAIMQVPRCFQERC
jgi:hypothetical protein